MRLIEFGYTENGVSGMKKIITLVVLLAVAGGAYWYVENKAAKEEAHMQIEADAAAAKAAKEAEEAAAKAAMEAEEAAAAAA